MSSSSVFFEVTSSSIFFEVVLFVWSSLVTGPSFMLISSLVLELRQFTFIRDSPEIQKPQILSSEFCKISRDWDQIRVNRELIILHRNKGLKVSLKYFLVKF